MCIYTSLSLSLLPCVTLHAWGRYMYNVYVYIVYTHKDRTYVGYLGYHLACESWQNLCLLIYGSLYVCRIYVCVEPSTINFPLCYNVCIYCTYLKETLEKNVSASILCILNAKSELEVFYWFFLFILSFFRDFFYFCANFYHSLMFWLIQKIL